MIDDDDILPDDMPEVSETEAKRQTEDLNDDAFAGIYHYIDQLIKFHNWADVQKAIGDAPAEKLREWIQMREDQERNLLYDLKRFVQNLREA